MISADVEVDIIHRLKKSDEKAMATVFKLHHKGLCYFALQLVKNKNEADDIVAESFLKLWQHRLDFDSFGQIRNFLYLVTRNKCYDHLKHLKRKSASHKEIIHLMEKEEEFIENKMIEAELLQMIMLEIDILPPMRRKIFKMIYVEDLTVFEVAGRLKITADTVRVQKARALAAIRSLILRRDITLLASLVLLERL